MAETAAQGQSGTAASQDYYIDAVPDLQAVTPGAVVRYIAVYKHSGHGERARLAEQPKPGSALPPDQGKPISGDHFIWYKLAAGSLVKDAEETFVDRGLSVGNQWTCTWGKREGEYKIACKIVDADTGAVSWCFRAQRVVSYESVLAPLMGQARAKVGVHPDEALEHFQQRYWNIVFAYQKKPGKTTEKEFHDWLRKQEDYYSKLADRLRSTDGMRRIPFHSIHWSERDQTNLQLKVFVCCTRFIPKHTVSRGDLDHEIPDTYVWRLVDWTMPDRPRVCHEFEERGSDTRQVLKQLLDSWEKWNNRYPEGKLSYELQVDGIKLEGSFETNGKTTWDVASEMLGYISTAATVVAGVATLVAPVPGSQLVSFALWSSMFSSTAASAINILQKSSEGGWNWSDHAFDALTIAGNVLGGAGMVTGRVAQIGEVAGWARGAPLETGLSGKLAHAVFLGQVANDSIQGAIVAGDYIQQLIDIRDDESLTPWECHDKLLQLVRNLAQQKLLQYVSAAAPQADEEHLTKQPEHVKKGEKFGTTPEATLSPKEKLDSLSNPASKPIDLQRAQSVPAEGKITAAAAGKNTADVHTTKAKVGAQSQEHVPIKGQGLVAARNKSGMKGKHFDRLAEFCKKYKYLIITRFSNAAGIRFQGDPNYRAKPHDVLLKSCKDKNEFEGLVVRPKPPTAEELKNPERARFWEVEQQNVKDLEAAGWYFDKNEVLHDPEGKMIFGDYDLMGIWEPTGKDAGGRPAYRHLVDQEVDNLLAMLNEEVSPDTDMFQHPGQNTYWMSDKEMGRQPGPKEQFVITTEEGYSFMIDSPRELHKLHDDWNLPMRRFETWTYENYEYQ